tara:strand:- start:239 stop:646 length:408 start_codon:yes stop_codon:yes gene_type:complete
MKNCLSLLFLFLILSCDDINEDGAITTDFSDCGYIDETVLNYDLFEGYFSLTLNHGYTPDIARDSIMNDYHFLKFKNEKLKGIYVIIDANTRYKTNKILPLDDISKKEYPFSINLLNEGACIFLDQIKTEQCECN